MTIYIYSTSMTHERIVADLDREGKSNEKTYFELSGISPNTSCAYEKTQTSTLHTLLLSSKMR